MAMEGFLCTFSFRVAFNSFNLLIFIHPGFQRMLLILIPLSYILNPPRQIVLPILHRPRTSWLCDSNHASTLCLHSDMSSQMSFQFLPRLESFMWSRYVGIYKFTPSLVSSAVWTSKWGPCFDVACRISSPIRVTYKGCKPLKVSGNNRIARMSSHPEASFNTLLGC